MRKQVRQMTDDPVVLRIIDQLKLQGKTEKELVGYLGMANGTVSSWKFANVKSYKTYISQIAEFLNVTEEYLLEGEDDVNNTITGREIKLIKLFRSMGNEQQKCFMKNAEFLAMSTKYERMDAIVSEEK